MLILSEPLGKAFGKEGKEPLFIKEDRQNCPRKKENKNLKRIDSAIGCKGGNHLLNIHTFQRQKKDSAKQDNHPVCGQTDFS